MQFKKILKFRYKDLPEEFTCKICKSVCQNSTKQELYSYEIRDCEPCDFKKPNSDDISLKFVNQIQQFI